MSDTQTTGYSRSGRLACLAGAVVILVTGVYLTHIHFMETEWITRSGCLIVMTGIWSGLGGVLHERMLLRQARSRRRNAVTAAKARLKEEGDDAGGVEQELDRINEAFDNQTTGAAQNARLSFGVLEVSLLLTGTFLWGFGDLFVR